jgi:hypothetical protein
MTGSSSDGISRLWDFVEEKLAGQIDADNLITVLGLLNLYTILNRGVSGSLPLTGSQSATDPAPELDTQNLGSTMAGLLNGPLGQKLDPATKTALSGLIHSQLDSLPDAGSEPAAEKKDRPADSLSLLTTLTTLLGTGGGQKLDPATLLALVSLLKGRERKEVRSPEPRVEKEVEQPEKKSSPSPGSRGNGRSAGSDQINVETRVIPRSGSGERK